VKWGLNSTTFRISNPYGPRQRLTRKQGVIPIFLQRIALGQPIELYGDGSAVRDYIYASDVASMIAATVDRPTGHDVYNIGSGQGTSLAELIDLASSITGREVLVHESPAPRTFVDRAVVDISRYTGEFGDPDLLPLREGIERTWQHTLEQLA
jgi:UDP-glucose 4-epimerase